MTPLEWLEVAAWIVSILWLVAILWYIALLVRQRKLNEEYRVSSADQDAEGSAQ